LNVAIDITLLLMVEKIFEFTNNYVISKILTNCFSKAFIYL